MMSKDYQLSWKTRLLDLLVNISKLLEKLSLAELKQAKEKPISPLIQH